MSQIVILIRIYWHFTNKKQTINPVKAAKKQTYSNSCALCNIFVSIGNKELMKVSTTLEFLITKVKSRVVSELLMLSKRGISVEESVVLVTT